MGDWENVLRTLFSANKISSKVHVKVILGPGLYTVAQLPKNENLTDKEYLEEDFKRMEQQVIDFIKRLNAYLFIWPRP